ncbi:hypothetical protein [Bradyrhizobium prioriisuperbiae]|uniref:hypothetical protein n=1 Tax=Bradyrhizobium prioriisuperbiae TaxID=2854389 RepID=UPI0028E21385|nr:hypothetical protein [Bradyrhizobium prioritasuperba]
MLEDPCAVPADAHRAVAATLAAVAGSDLREAIDLCLAHLSPVDSEFLVADVIARGRAADAFAELV